jgi:hypothetical protein
MHLRIELVLSPRPSLNVIIKHNLDRDAELVAALNARDEALQRLESTTQSLQDAAATIAKLSERLELFGTQTTERPIGLRPKPDEPIDAY